MKWIFIHSWCLFHSKSLNNDSFSLVNASFFVSFPSSATLNGISFSYGRCFIQYFISVDSPFQFQLHFIAAIASSSFLWWLFHVIFHSSWHLFQLNFHFIVVATSFSLKFCFILCGSCFMQYFIFPGIYFNWNFISSW